MKNLKIFSLLIIFVAFVQTNAGIKKAIQKAMGNDVCNRTFIDASGNYAWVTLSNQPYTWQCSVDFFTEMTEAYYNEFFNAYYTQVENDFTGICSAEVVEDFINYQKQTQIPLEHFNEIATYYYGFYMNPFDGNPAKEVANAPQTMSSYSDSQVTYTYKNTQIQNGRLAVANELYKLQEFNEFLHAYIPDTQYSSVDQETKKTCFDNFLIYNKSFFSIVAGLEEFYGADPALNSSPIFRQLSCIAYPDGTSDTCSTINFPNTSGRYGDNGDSVGHLPDYTNRSQFFNLN